MKQFVVRHVSVNTGRAYPEFVAAIDRLIGRHDPAAYADALRSQDFDAVRRIIAGQAGESGLMAFLKLEMGALLDLERGAGQAVQYLIGNPLIAMKMMIHDIAAGLYAPLRVLVVGDGEGRARVEYDLPSSMFGSLDDDGITAVALDLDAKLASLIRQAAD